LAVLTARIIVKDDLQSRALVLWWARDDINGKLCPAQGDGLVILGTRNHDDALIHSTHMSK
jgi:hypothetical protein